MLIGFVSEFLVHAVDAAGTALGLGKVFMGVVVVAVVGNAAEHSTAIVVAMKDKMDLALGHRDGLVDADRALRGPGPGDRRPLHRARRSASSSRSSRWRR